MKSHLAALGKWLWIVCCIAILLAALYFYDGKPNSDAEVLLAYGMLILSFPFGLLLSTVVGILGYWLYVFFGYVLTTNYWSLFITWLCLFMVGYWQWFRFLPWIIQKVRRVTRGKWRRRT